MGMNTILNGEDNNIYGCNGITKFTSILNGCSNSVVDSNFSSIINGINNCLTHNCSTIAGTNITSRATSSLHVNNILLETGSIPTTDPGIPGMLFIAGGALKVSGCIA